MTSTTEPMLDGMPEPPPAWQRPAHGVRLSALGLEHMLAAALPHCGVDDDLPQLMAISLDVADGLLTARATDRYSLIRERRPISQTCADFGFLLRSEDASSLRVLLRAVLRGLKDETRDAEPVDLALEHTDTGPMLRVLGSDLDVRFTEQANPEHFPNTDRLLERPLAAIATDDLDAFDVHINPSLLARIVAAQRAGRAAGLFRFQKPTGQGPVVVTTVDEEDDLVLVVMPIRTGADEPGSQL